MLTKNKCSDIIKSMIERLFGGAVWKKIEEYFVKVNYKNIGELNSFIYDSMNGVNKNKDKYVMCAGKYARMVGQWFLKPRV